MKTEIFKIQEFDLIGDNLFTYESIGEFEEDKITRKDGRIVEVFNEKMTFSNTKLHTLSETKKGYNKKYNKLLPYWADVTQDINMPKTLIKKGLKPEVFKDCQLLSQTHGGYLEFWYEETKQKLRIAINSNTYNPLTVSNKELKKGHSYKVLTYSPNIWNEAVFSNWSAKTENEKEKYFFTGKNRIYPVLKEEIQTRVKK